MSLTPTQDASARHWIYRLPKDWQPYGQLSRLDRPVGYWLLALPGWMGLAFAGLKTGYATSDAVWALFIFIGAIAMRGAGCTYNDIVDQDLDVKVARTALRPLPAGHVTTKQAWIWLFIQVGIGFCVWLTLPMVAKLVALGSIPLVAAYPFMKRITWWPQLWLGLTFNWAFLVAVAIKTGAVNIPALIFYAGLIFWTVGYDTIYAMQDVEDDALIGVKSTARRFGRHVRKIVSIFYLLTASLIFVAVGLQIISLANPGLDLGFYERFSRTQLLNTTIIICVAFGLSLLAQPVLLRPDSRNALRLFKINGVIMVLLGAALIVVRFLWELN
ncbi:4-hydroxybenzoate octaprenyltransferase [Robiginitomaculum antarcticum]|uniref:4-hydroxybenzoate octaprenyltransferase n=1 Tax=Robiginitomaculum antarcticum TaxID=437507 RepID=UPI00035E9D81|nr:4-hydroxybenzoate octaprenyltransferase [Robiginitomaculum antarcticum]